MWIFQGRPDRIDMTSAFQVGQKVPWKAKRYKNSMKEGDTVLFWQSGDPENRGVHAIGKILTKPYTSKWGDELVDVEILSLVEKPLLATEIKKDGSFNNLQILRSPIGTNFKVAEEERTAFTELLSAYGKIASDER